MATKGKGKSSTKSESSASTASAAKGTVMALKKITASTVMGKLGIPKPKEGEVIPLYTVIGRAFKTKGGKTQYGEWTGFTGIFEATRDADGQRFKSAGCILREPFESELVDVLRQNDEAGNKTGVEFAIKVSVEYSAKGNTGYSYVLESLIEAKTNTDSLAHLREKAQLALTAS